MGLFDNFRAVLGQPNPADQMGEWEDEAQKQNRQAIGMDANGNPILPGSAAAAQASGTLPAGQEPNATKTPKSLGHMMMDLAQYQQDKQGFNQALGAGFAAFAQPRDRSWVSGMFNVNPIDAAQYGRQLQEMSSAQQGQDRANMVNRLVNDQTIGPQIAQAFGMDWGALKAGVLADPALMARIAETWGAADPRVRAGAQVTHGALGGAGGGAGIIGDVGKQIVAGVAGDDNAAMNQAQMDWDLKHPGQVTPWARDNLTSFQRYTADQLDRQTAAREFLTKNHGTSIDKATEFQHRVEALKTDPGMIAILQSPNFYKAAIDWIRKNPDSTEATLANALPEWAGYPSEVKRALSEIQLLRSRDYSNALHSIGQRFSTQEVQNVAKGMDTLLNIELGPNDYNSNLDDLIDETKTIRGNSHGAAQEFNTMDPELRTYVNPTFTKGGRSNVEGSGSEDWADKVKPPQAMIDEAKAALEKGASRKAIERRFREKGFRPMGF